MTREMETVRFLEALLADIGRLQGELDRLAARVRGELEAETGPCPGGKVTMAQIMELPDLARRVALFVNTRGAASAEDVACGLDIPSETVAATVAELVTTGFLVEDRLATGAEYRVNLGHKKPRGLPGDIWALLDGKLS